MRKWGEACFFLEQASARVRTGGRQEVSTVDICDQARLPGALVGCLRRVVLLVTLTLSRLSPSETPRHRSLWAILP